jgi:hypothetical protein
MGTVLLGRESPPVDCLSAVLQSRPRAHWIPSLALLQETVQAIIPALDKFIYPVFWPLIRRSVIKRFGRFFPGIASCANNMPFLLLICT